MEHFPNISSSRVVICSLGAPSLELLAQRFRGLGCEVFMFLPKTASSPSHNCVDWTVHLDWIRPEAIGLVARFAGDTAILIDGWGLPDDLIMRDRAIRISYDADLPSLPEVDLASLLLSIAGGSFEVTLSADSEAKSEEIRTDTMRILEALGLDVSQIRHLASERII